MELPANKGIGAYGGTTNKPSATIAIHHLPGQTEFKRAIKHQSTFVHLIGIGPGWTFNECPREHKGTKR
jgi:hypothetical protein